MHTELKELLAYRNQAVMSYFCHHHAGYSMLEAQELFTDLLAWLWLKEQRQKKGKHTYLFGPLLVLDELWHSFILHTHDYVAFSHDYFGQYLHHQIEPIGLEHHMSEDQLADFLHDCFAYIGEQWVERRFVDALNLPF